MSPDFLPQLWTAFRGWWRDESRQKGLVGVSGGLARELWGFLRDSTPERRRRRYGDMDYDWEHRVNTTAGTVGWRERLLGVFHSPYQPTDHRFRRIVGVEILPKLHRAAEENIRAYKSPTQQCAQIESVCGDATEFPLPDGPLVLYLFNPLPEAGLVKVLANLEQSLQQNPRSVHVLYHNPLLDSILAPRRILEKIGGTVQFSSYRASGRNSG